MTIRYRVLCGLAVLGFTGLGQPVLGQAVPTAEDSLKGQIWTVTARRIWTDIKPKQPPQPKPWATGTDFTKWALTQKDDKSELGLLRGAVIDRIGKGHTGTPDQVAQAILAEIAQRKQNKTGALARLDAKSLQTDFAEYVQAAPVRPDTATTSTSASASTAAVVVPATDANITEDPNPVPDSLPSRDTEPSYSVPVPADTHFGVPFWAAALALALAGAAIGAALYAVLKPSRRSNRRHRTSEYSAQSENSVDMHSQEYKQLKKENQLLRGEVHHLKNELAELKAQVAGKPAPKFSPAPLPAPELELADDDLLTPMPLAEMPVERSSQPQAVTRYGPVQETPFLEDRKIADMALPQLALMLTMHPSKPDQASFTLNPQVNQAMLIGDGLNRLQKFFEYDPPIGRISSVTAAAPGRLQRHADGWQVVERAKLTIR